MGGVFSGIFDRLTSYFLTKEVRILILGLDNAGKTTILYRLQFDEIIETIPTIGFNVETVRYKNTTFQVWDLGGQVSIRPFWRCYFPNTQALIFVVDSADHERLAIASQELKMMLEEEELKDVVLLILANKQDMPEALNVEQISEALGLASIRSHRWTIVKTSAIKGTGISEGLDWIVSALGA